MEEFNIIPVLILASLAIILLFAGKYLKLPSIISFLLLGVVAGYLNSEFNLLGDDGSTHQIEIVGKIGVVLLLFTIGLEFSIERLVKSWRFVIIGGVVQVSTTILAITAARLLFGSHLHEAIIFGFIVSLSSTAIVMKLLQSGGEVETIQGNILLGILIFQDIAIIPMMMLIPSSPTENPSALPTSDLFIELVPIALLLLFALVLYIWVIPWVIHRISDTEHSILRSRPVIKKRGTIHFAFALFFVTLFWILYSVGITSGPHFSLFYRIITYITIFLLMLAMYWWIVPHFLYRVALEKNRDLFFFSITGICLMVMVLTSYVGISPELAAFFAGIIIAESEYSIDALAHITPFKDLFASVFFISIGMLLNLTVVSHYSFEIATMVLLILGVKIVTGSFAVSLLGISRRLCIFSGMALCQIGEFSFVLAQKAQSSNLLDDKTYQTFIAGAIITMALTPLAMKVSPYITDLSFRLLPSKKEEISQPEEGSKSSDSKNKESFSDHIVIVGYGVTGRSVARAAEVTGIPYTVIELDPDIVKKKRDKGFTHFIFGDAIQNEVLEHAGIREAQAIIVVISEAWTVPRIIRQARSLSPDIYIIARTRQIDNTKTFLEAGADEVISEEFETSLEIFSRILSKYGLADPEIIKIRDSIKRRGMNYFIRKYYPGAKGIQNPPHDFDSVQVRPFVVTPGSVACGRSLLELGLGSKFVLVEFALKSGGKTIAHPPLDTILNEGDTLIIFGTEENITHIQPLFMERSQI